MSTLASPAPWWIDGVRARVYRLFAPWLGRLYGDRTRRVVWMGLLSISVSFTVTLVAPLWLLALGPLVMGVPHLVADARYLVVQPQLHRRGPLLWAAAVPLLATGFGAPPAFSLLSLLPATLAARGATSRKLLALGAWLGLTVVALAWETPFLWVFLHGHNLVALAWWWVLRPRTRFAWLVPAAVLGASTFLLVGGAEPVLTLAGGWSAPASMTSFDEFVQTVAPFTTPTLGARVVLSFAFLQSVHYALWLRLVPEDARARPAPRPFRETWRALARDFGQPLLWAFVALWLFIAAWGVVSLAGARLGYLQLAAFHGYLELAAAVFFFVEARRPTC